METACTDRPAREADAPPAQVPAKVGEAADTPRDLALALMADVLVSDASMRGRSTAVKAIAERFSLDAGELLAELETGDGMTAALRRRDAMMRSGELHELKAGAALSRLIDTIDAQIRAGEVPPTATPKVADALMRASGLSERRAARLRQDARPEGPSLVLNINIQATKDKPAESFVLDMGPACVVEEGGEHG